MISNHQISHQLNDYLILVDIIADCTCLISCDLKLF